MFYLPAMRRSPHPLSLRRPAFVRHGALPAATVDEEMTNPSPHGIPVSSAQEYADMIQRKIQQPHRCSSFF